MTQRSNHSPSRTTANAVAKAVVVARPHPADIARIETLIVNVALAALVVVVVLLITTPTGAG